MSSGPSASSTPTDIPGVSLLDLFRFSTKFELFLNFIGLIAAIASGCATPFMSLIFGNLISSFVEIGRAGSDGSGHLASVADGFRHNATKDALQLVYLGLGMFVACFVFISIWSYTGEQIARRIRERYFRAVIHQDLSFYDDVTAGEVATRIEMNAHLIQQGISEKLALIASYFSSFVTGLAIAYVKSWRLALALSAIIPCILMVGAFITVAGTRHSKRSLEALSKAGGTAQESLSTVRTIFAFGAERKLSTIYDAFVAESCDHDMNFSNVVGIGMAVFSFIVYSSYSLSFYFGTTLLLQGRASAGTVVTVGLSILVGSFSLAIVGPNVEAVVHALEAARHLYSVIDRVPPIDSQNKHGTQLSDIFGKVSFNDVTFSYSSRKDAPLLKHLDLTFPASKTCALVGLSGSGKSTIVSLIERFYDVDSGSIFLDDVDIRDLNIKWLRAQIGLVSQDPILFSTTVRENVALGLLGTLHEGLPPKETFALVKEACIKAHAHDFTLGLPNGYDTQVGDGGMLLSGGQKQRIAIARAVVSDPKILLLDEATSALDTQSEGIVQAALTRASQGRTTIVIAHRLSTVMDADLIYVMGGGSVLENGTHDELMAENGSYAKLVHAQRLDHGDVMEDVDEETDGGLLSPVSAGRLSSKGASRSTVNVSSGQETPVVKSLGTFALVRQLSMFIPDTKWMYAWGTVFGCLGGLVHPAFGIVYAMALHAFESSDLHVIRTAGNQNALWLFLIAIGSTLCLSLHNVLFGKAAVTLVARLRTLSFQALLKKDVLFYDLEHNNPGTLTANLIGRPEKVKGFATMTLGAMLQCISCCVGGAIVGLIFGWKLGLVGIACMPPIVAMGFLRLQLVADKERDAKEAHNRSAQVASEAVVAIKTVASLTCENYLCSRYSTALRRPLRQTIAKTAVSNAIFSFSLAVILFAVALVFWYGSRLVASGEYTTFQFYVSFMSTVFGSWNAANVFLSVPDISSAADAIREILPLLEISRRSADNAEKHPPEKSRPIQGKVNMKDISFRYPSRPEVKILKGFNVTIEPETYVAFVGPSGSGKSTLIQLIERFYEPTSGQIYFDETALSQLPKEDYRSHISLVSQDTRLYSGTIRFNVTLGLNRAAEEVSDEEVHRACSTANILEFIQTLPKGFDTEVGERGSQLSGGQKQRIAIARALIRDPKLLLLDEATSALDANSEAVVQHALNKAADGRTTVAIAHRLSSIQHAHRIYFLQHGRIIEAGTHSQLLARKGPYYRFAQLQQLGNDRPARFSIDLFMKK